MRFMRDLRESKVIRLVSRTQFCISLYCNNGMGVAFFSSTKEFYLCFHSVLPAFHSSYKRALSYCSWETKIERRGSARHGAANARNTFYAEWKVEEMWRDAPLPRRVLLKIRAQGTCRNGKLFRRRRDISAADAGREMLRICVSGYCAILYLYLSALYESPRPSNEILEWWWGRDLLRIDFFCV